MARSSTRPIVQALALLAVLGMVATGCGGAPNADPPQRDATQATTPQPLAPQEPAGPASATVAPATPTPAVPDSSEDAAAGDATADPERDRDGAYPAYIVTADPEELTVDRIEVLAGAEAAAARAEDGEPAVEEGVDVPYLRNRNPRLRTLPVADDVAVRVYDCSAGCQLVAWEYADLVAGRPLPYGSPTTPFTITVSGGHVVEVVEVYLA